MKIAIVKLSALGDIVHAAVALQFIRQALPTMQIDWVVEQRFADLLQHNPDINRIITVNLKALKQHKSRLLAEIRQLKARADTHYDWVIDAQGLIKSALTARLLTGHTVGFDQHSIREKPAAWLYQKKIHCPYDANTIDRNVAVIGQPLGVDITPQQIIHKTPFLFYQPTDTSLIQPYLATNQANVLLVIGSTWASRNYPKENYLQVIRALDVHCLIIWGTDLERQSAEWIARHASNVQLIPRIDLNALKALIASVDLVIGNDTGPTHMAWALNIPSITLFGPTPVSRVYQTPINKVLKSPSIVNPYQLDKNDFSIKDISKSDVIHLAHQLLADRK